MTTPTLSLGRAGVVSTSRGCILSVCLMANVVLHFDH
jgi:hypothetical protein